MRNNVAEFPLIDALLSRMRAATGVGIVVAGLAIAGSNNTPAISVVEPVTQQPRSGDREQLSTPTPMETGHVADSNTWPHGFETSLALGAGPDLRTLARPLAQSVVDEGGPAFLTQFIRYPLRAPQFFLGVQPVVLSLAECIAHPLAGPSTNLDYLALLTSIVGAAPLAPWTLAIADERSGALPTVSGYLISAPSTIAAGETHDWSATLHMPAEPAPTWSLSSLTDVRGRDGVTREIERTPSLVALLQESTVRASQIFGIGTEFALEYATEPEAPSGMGRLYLVVKTGLDAEAASAAFARFTEDFWLDRTESLSDFPALSIEFV